MGYRVVALQLQPWGRGFWRAIRPDGRLLLIDIVLRTGSEPDDLGRGRDMHMLVTLEGRERTAAEVEVLLSEAGFALARVIPTASLQSIVETVGPNQPYG